MKKIYGVIFLLLCLLLSACGSINDTPKEESKTGTYVEATAEPTQAISQEVVKDSAESAHVLSKEEPIELKVYSQLSSWKGEQVGWFAKVMLDKFNVKLNYILESDTKENLITEADMVIIMSVGKYYKEAVENGLLLDWETDNLLKEHGSYILEHLPQALEYNRNLTPMTDKVFGFGSNVVPNSEVSEEFFYTWDIRWDLYQKLGYPEVTNLDDFVVLLEAMKELCPTDDNGEETYAMSLWSDWDSNMVMTVKSMATAYYGYDEFHLGLYDSETGIFYGALEENGPYLEMLRFFNTLYRKGLLDPDSDTQTYEDMLVKLENSGVFFSVFNYAGSGAYNTETHLAEEQYMASLLPQEASPAAYGLSVYGDNRIWAIGANSRYPELCMEIINWLSTPEGRLTYSYGPQGVTWDYDEERNTYFTKLGKDCIENRTILLPEEYGGMSFQDGAPQMNNVTWSYDAPNPDSNGETYNFRSWKSNIAEASCNMEQDWRAYTGATSATEYIKTQNYVVVPKVPYEASEKSNELETMWEQVSEGIVTGSWAAIYAETEAEFEQIVAEMIADAKDCGYEKCITWCEYEAMRREKLEKEVRFSDR